jgi:glutamate-1-semialdehyde 2,1-aminomutase
MDKFKVLHLELLKRGIYFGPSGYEVGFVSAAHSEADMELAATKVNEAMDVALSP